MAVHCPNCSQEVSCEPIRCPRCGYQSELRPEYLWLYGGGTATILLGVAFGLAGVSIEGAGPEHWSAALQGWFPLGPWPPRYHWMAFLLEGIGLTLAGLGITRQRRAAWFLLGALLAWDLSWTVSRLLEGDPPRHQPALAAALLALEGLCLALAARLLLALRRVPPRDRRPPGGA